MPQLDAYNLTNWAFSSIVSTLYSYCFFVLVFMKSYLVTYRMRLAKFNLLVWGFIYVFYDMVIIYRKSLFKKRKVFFKFGRKKFMRRKFLRLKKNKKGKSFRSSLYFLFSSYALKPSIVPGRVLLFKVMRSLFSKKLAYVFNL